MLKEKLHELISACFTGIWIETHEQHEAIAEIQRLCREQEWQLAVWDVDRGFSTGAEDSLLEATDPLAAIRAVNAMATPEGTAILVMKNLHKFISSTEVLQALQHQLRAAATAAAPTTVVTVAVTAAPMLQSPSAPLPPPQYASSPLVDFTFAFCKHDFWRHSERIS